MIREHYARLNHQACQHIQLASFHTLSTGCSGVSSGKTSLSTEPCTTSDDSRIELAYKRLQRGVSGAAEAGAAATVDEVRCVSSRAHARDT